MADFRQRKAFQDALFAGKFPGHGVRVAVPFPKPDTPRFSPSWEERAQHLAEIYRWECQVAEAVDDDHVPIPHLWSGTAIFAEAFGCPVHQPADSPGFALPLVETADEADRLVQPGPAAFEKYFRLGERVLELCGVSGPLRIFDVQSPFDIAALIWRKETFFSALVDHPEAVHRLLDKTTATVIQAVRAFQARFGEVCLVHHPHLWMEPSRGLCLSEDEAGSISSGMFVEFALPHLRRLAAEFGGLGMHCCARAMHQWRYFADIAPLRYLNLVHPTTSFEKSIEVFSDRAVLVPSVSLEPDRQIEWVEQALRLAQPQTRYFFILAAETIEAGAEMVRQVRRLCRQAAPAETRATRG